MKNLIFGFFVALLSVLSVNSQWEVQEFSNYNFKQVSFVNSLTGFAIADHGKCLRTQDGGVSWQVQVLPTSKDLISIAFLKGSSVGVIGGMNIILTSVDNGLNWSVYREWNPPATDSTYEVCVAARGTVFDLFINKWAPGPYPYTSSTYFQLDENFSEREIFVRASKMYKIKANDQDRRDNYAYVVWAQEFNPFGATNVLLYLDKNFNLIANRNYTNNYGLFDLISSQLFYNSYSSSHSNGYSKGQHLLAVSTGEAVSEFFYETASNWNGHYIYTLRGIPYNAGSAVEDITDRNSIYIVGANEQDRDNPRTRSCIKRLDLSQNRIYPELSLDNVFLNGFTSTEDALYAWSSTGSILRKLRNANEEEGKINTNESKKFKSGNYPNPFNPTTTIRYSIPEDSKVSLRVYDITGKEVANLVNDEMKEAGDYSAVFNAGNFSSGIYFYTLISNNSTSTKKMMLIK